MKPYHDAWGYLKICLFHGGKKVQKTVHRLVGEAFIPNTFNKPEINHIDGNKENNNIDNLEWVTRSENEIHAFKNKLNIRESYNAGRPKRRVMIIETGETFDSIAECARKLECSYSNVVYCLSGKYKKCMGYHLTSI